MRYIHIHTNLVKQSKVGFESHVCMEQVHGTVFREFGAS